MDDPPRDLADPGVVANFRHALAGGRKALGRARLLAEYAESRFPGMRETVLLGLEFHRRCAAWAVTQCVPRAEGAVFAPAGLPAPGESLHARAMAADPSARFAYFDADPKTTGKLRTALGVPGRVAAGTAPAHDPGALLASPVLGELGLTGKPVSMHLVLAVHRWHADLAAEAIAGYGKLLPPGSSLCLSAGIPDPGPAGEELIDMLSLAGGPAFAHTTDDIARWIAEAGLVLHGRGITDAGARGWAASQLPRRRYPGRVVEAVAMVPDRRS